MTHRKTALTLAALGTVSALALAGCSSTPGGGADDEELRLGMVTPLTSFAPWEASWANQSPYLQAVYDTLLRAEPDGTVVPGLANDWAWNDDRTELTLTLREGVEFSDGEALTSEVVAESLTRFRDGTSENASFLAAVESIETPDANTAVIVLSEPDPALETYLTQNAGLVGGSAMWDSADAQTTPIGTGPYTLDDSGTVPGSTYVFEAKEDYWDPESVHYDEIIMNVYGDATALMNAVKGGQVDATNTQTPSQIPEAEAAGYTANLIEQTWTGFVLADRDGTLNPALGDPLVRQAFNLSLDREGLVQALAGGYGTPTTQVFSTTSGAYVDALDDAYPYDPERARELLAEAGYPDGVTITMPSSDFVPESTFALYSEQLGEGGFDIVWEMSGDDFFGQLLGGSYEAFSMQLQVDPTPWQTMQFSMLPWSTWNPFRVEDPQIMEYMTELRTAEGAEAEAIGAELNTYIVEQAWYAPVFRNQSAFLTNADTVVEMQSDNAVPYLWNITPAQ
ncbi:ABC transporter substrate-binding protein [Microbacterium aurantiacum]|uniref:ABC transporter substrate-binding protein n=1 Tax=Microbacterium aurantiacum TaxID=162393 RepID=UPI004036DE3B